MGNHGFGKANMKTLSAQCARSDMSCENCELVDCGCRCHIIQKLKTPRVTVPKRRYFSEKHGGIWGVFDRGPDSGSKKTRLIAECSTLKDASNIQQALNKQKR